MEQIFNELESIADFLYGTRDAYEETKNKDLIIGACGVAMKDLEKVREKIKDQLR